MTHCAADRQAAEPLLILLRRFATESAREEARMFCDELMAEEAIAPHDLIAPDRITLNVVPARNASSNVRV
jgi:hypothetical protein